MPPKVKVTKETIVAAAVDIVRKNGVPALNARTLAANLSCSTQPIFSNFTSMEELQEAVILQAYQLYMGFLEQEAASREYPPYKAFGMAYIRFAKEEKELFRLLFMRDRSGQPFTASPDFEASVALIMNANHISRQAAERIHLEMWACVHGIGTMLVTSFLELDKALISDILSDVYHGTLARYLQEANQ